MHDHLADTTEVQPTAPRASRRHLLRLAGAAAVGTVAAAVHGSTALAANGQNMIIGGNNLGTQTVLRSDADTIHAVLIVDHTTNGTGNGIESTAKGPLTAGVHGIGDFAGAGVRGVNPHPAGSGVEGWSEGDHGIGVKGVGGRYGVVGIGNALNGGTGAAAAGTRAAMQLEPYTGTDPRSRADKHTFGEIDVDLARSLWACVDTGNPGTWRRIAGPQTAGAFVAVTPKRVFDSRWAGFGGPLASGTQRIVDVADGRDLVGVVDVPNLVEAGATALVFTLTVTGTTGKGFLAITPSSASNYSASTVNWSAKVDVAANTSTVVLGGTRQVKLFCGGAGSTQAIVDVVGYYA